MAEGSSASEEVEYEFGRLDSTSRIPDDFDAPLPDEVLKLFKGE
jgi:hypothetical protein